MVRKTVYEVGICHVRLLRLILTENTENRNSSIWTYLVEIFDISAFLRGLRQQNLVNLLTLTLFRATKNSVVICRAILLYKLGHPFHSTLFVNTYFKNIFRPDTIIQIGQLRFRHVWSMMTLSKYINRQHSWLLTWKNQYERKNQYISKIIFCFLRLKHQYFLKKTNSAYSFTMNKIGSGQTLRSDWTYRPWRIRICRAP